MLSDYPSRTTIPVSDIDRARTFYTDTLGFAPEHDSAVGVYFRSGGMPFYIFPSAGRSSGQHTQIAWQVPDIEVEVADLKRRGVVFEEYNLPNFKTVNSIATTPQL